MAVGTREERRWVAVVVAALVAGRRPQLRLALVAVTPLAHLVGHLAAPSPAGPLLRDRAVETVIGVAVGVLVGWLTRNRRSAPAA